MTHFFKNKRILIGILLVFLVYSLSLTVIGAGLETAPIAKLDVFDADIRDVFRSLGELGSLSVLIDPDVKASVTISLKEGLTIKESIELLAQTYGYSYRWLPNNRTVIIGNEKTFVNFEAKETRIYHLNYAQPDQVVDALKVIIPKDNIGIDKRTNQLTVVANVLQQQNIAEIITRLDREMPQITIEARVEEVKRSALQDLGAKWTPDDITINFSQPSASVVASHTLALWEEKSLARVLSNPKIATTDSQEGTIFIGDKYPIITKDQTDKGITYKIEYIEIGTKLTVTPRINENNVVTVTVKASVSNLTEWKKAGDNDIPVMRNREANSVIRLQDGETFVLSGLNEIKSVDKETKIKGLGNIPIIGWLFKNKKSDPNEDTEVCIFITPRIVQPKKPLDNSNAGALINKQTETAKPENKSQTNNQTIANEEKKSAPETVAKPETKQPVIEETKPVTEQIQSEAVADQVEPTESVDTATTEIVSDEESVSSSDSVVNTDFVSPTTEIVSDEESVSSSDSVVNTDVVSPTTEAVIVFMDKQIEVKVKPGETINLIAKKYGVAVESIFQLNKLKEGTKLKVGQTLVLSIPKEHIYQLKPKETLWRISKRYGVDIKLLQEINKIPDITKVKAGQEIILPVDVGQISNSAF